MKTRGLGTIGAALAAATLLLGTTTASTAAPAPRELATGTPEAAYVTTIRALLPPDAPRQSDSDLIQGGKDICAQFAEGQTWADYLADVKEYQLDTSFHTPAIYAAVMTFCPDQRHQLP